MQIEEVMDTTQDKESLHYKIPAFGQHVCIVLFNQFKWDAVLVPLGSGTPDAETQADYLMRGLRMVATFGFLDGKFCAAFEQPAPDESAVAYLARLYTEFLYKTLVTQAPSKAAADNAVDWLRRLYELPSEERSKEN
jgi:hypothetical protein